MIFYTRLGAGFTRKSRFVSDGNKVNMPPSMAYVSVVQSNGIWIVLILAALNILDVNCAGVQNMYLNKNRRKGYGSELENIFVFTREY